MRVAIHQPEHLPYGGFFEKMARCDVFVFLDDVQFNRRNFQHRNRLTHDDRGWIKVHLRKHPRERPADVAASVLASVVGILTKKSIEATRRYHRNRLIVVGGVAASVHLRQALAAAGGERDIAVSFPPLSLCTDNAAMIAAAGAFRHRQLGESHSLSLSPNPALGLGDGGSTM